MDAIERFSRYYGWIHNTKEVADYLNISVNEAYELNITECLNYLSLLKAKSKMEEQILKNAKSKF